MGQLRPAPSPHFADEKWRPKKQGDLCLPLQQQLQRKPALPWTTVPSCRLPRHIACSLPSPASSSGGQLAPLWTYSSHDRGDSQAGGNRHRPKDTFIVPAAMGSNGPHQASVPRKEPCRLTAEKARPQRGKGMGWGRACRGVGCGDSTGKLQASNLRKSLRWQDQGFFPPGYGAG